MKCIDANVFIRAFSHEHPDATLRSQRFLRGLRHERPGTTTTEAIIAEVVRVLTSRALYDLPRDEVRDRLSTLLGLQGMRVDDKSIFVEALDLFAANPRLDFPDAVCATRMRARGITEIVSYDRDFDKLEGIVRIEP